MHTSLRSVHDIMSSISSLVVILSSFLPWLVLNGRTPNAWDLSAHGSQIAPGRDLLSNFTIWLMFLALAIAFISIGAFLRRTSRQARTFQSIAAFFGAAFLLGNLYLLTQSDGVSIIGLGYWVALVGFLLASVANAVPEQVSRELNSNNT